MGNDDWLAERFEANRSHLRAVAYRMLGSTSEADDAVQEAWIRVSRADTSAVENLGGWLTTVVSRVCLDRLRSRTSRREEPLEMDTPAPTGSRDFGIDPERDALMADSVGAAMLVVLDTLTPAERLAYVLHDMFAVPFDEIAPLVERSPTAARQLASRARRRVQGASAGADASDGGKREIVDAFLAASRGGDFEALLALLDPNIVLRADRTAVALGASAETHGATKVAETFPGRARAARPALIDGAAGAVWAPGGKPRVVIEFTITGGTVVAIDLVADPQHLNALDLVFLDD